MSMIIFILASETWCLARLLPILIGDLVDADNKYWKCFLLLLEITIIVLAPKVTRGLVDCLANLIDEHHHMFIKLYPDRKLTPKMHYMIHLTNWMAR